jgi:uncharacterized protein (DUF433 family)
METVTHSIDLIVSNPNVRNGRPTLKGRTLTVEDIVIVMVYHQQDADGIAQWFDISLAEVHAALAYYYQNKRDIDASMQHRRELADEYKEKRIGSRHKPLFDGNLSPT